MKNKDTKVPIGYEGDLSEYGAQFFDSYCGEPIGWGFRIINRLGEERFNKIREFGSLECGGYPDNKWYLITKWLTPQEAIKKYGKVTEQEVGPKGGWKNITFGKTKFMSRRLDPRNITIEK